jgi:hypothetical protein
VRTVGALVLAVLAATDRAEFSFVRDAAQLSDSAPAKQLATLDERGSFGSGGPCREATAHR